MNLKLLHALFSNTNMGHLLVVFIERFLSGALCPDSTELVLLCLNDLSIV